jgi:hypothetical protein
MDRACSTPWGRIGIHRVSVGKPEGKRPPGRPRCKWEDTIKMNKVVLTGFIWLWRGTSGGLL